MEFLVTAHILRQVVTAFRNENRIGSAILKQKPVTIQWFVGPLEQTSLILKMRQFSWGSLLKNL
jgi:hypothetical protein